MNQATLKMGSEWSYSRSGSKSNSLIKGGKSRSASGSKTDTLSGSRSGTSGYSKSLSYSGSNITS